MFVFPQFALLLGITSVMLDFVMLIYAINSKIKVCTN